VTRSASPKTCNVEDCSRKHHARGYCSKHLQRVNKYGDPHRVFTGPDAGEAKDKLPKYIRKEGSGCWTWTGVRSNGYGRVWRLDEKRYVPAHRLVYEVYVGSIPEGLELAHLCGNRGCVNPEHLKPMQHDEHMRMDLGVPGPCSVKGCDRAPVTRGLCPRCYTRWHRHNKVKEQI